MEIDRDGLPKLVLVKKQPRGNLPASGRPGRFSATWEIKGLEGLIVHRFHPRRPLKSGSSLPPFDWCVDWDFAVVATAEGPVVLRPREGSLTDQIRAALGGKSFPTRAEALWAVRVELSKRL